MESPRKFSDCYFYYYSTCTKGDNCVFRHEPSALGCETMCAQWQQGKCLDKHCKLRHMELRKNRKQIPCYWENQPGGCRKKHCPFQHKNPEARTDGIAPSQPQPANTTMPIVSPVDVEPTSAPLPAPAPAPAPLVMPHELLWQQQPRQVVLDSAILGVLPSSELMARRGAPNTHETSAMPQYAPLPVDPLVVNFEEESDNESVPSSTPTKNVSPEECKSGKDHELLLLEKIQAETAALYGYDADTPPRRSLPTLKPVLPERRIVRTSLKSKYERLSLDEIAGRPRTQTDKRNSLDFKVLTLEEIRARKRSSQLFSELTSPAKRKLSIHEISLKTDSNSVAHNNLENSENVGIKKLPVNKNSRKRTLSDSVRNDELESTNADICCKIKKVEEIYKVNNSELISTSSELQNVCDINLSEIVKCGSTSEIVECSSTNINIVETIVNGSAISQEHGENISEILQLHHDAQGDEDLNKHLIDSETITRTIEIFDEDSLLESEELSSDSKISNSITIGTIVDLSKLGDFSNIQGVFEDDANDLETGLNSVIPDIVASCQGDRSRTKNEKNEIDIDDENL